MDYEGLYRKSGGSSQIKFITQLFERGNYESIDLMDTDIVNDVSSITSVLKSYFRALPNPLLTFALHETFIDASVIRDPIAKVTALTALVAQLPREYYETLRVLMLHLYESVFFLTLTMTRLIFGNSEFKSEKIKIEWTLGIWGLSLDVSLSFHGVREVINLSPRSNSYAV
jgi:hypothetical protein